MPSKKKMTREEALAWLEAGVDSNLPSLLACAVPPPEPSVVRLRRGPSQAEWVVALAVVRRFAGAYVDRRAGGETPVWSVRLGVRETREPAAPGSFALRVVARGRLLAARVPPVPERGKNGTKAWELAMSPSTGC